MNKTKVYKNTFFSIDVIEKAIDKLKEITNKVDIKPSTLFVCFENEQWQHDNISEFFSDYIKNPVDVHFNIYHENNGFAVHYLSYKRGTDIGVNGSNRKEIEDIFNIFDSNSEKCKLPIVISNQEIALPKIFIGHGRKEYWKELSEHLQYKHGFQIEAFETGARAGHTAKEILQSMLDSSSFALLVLTGEDILASSEIRARQNVIHEVGLFQGRLGFNKAILLVEDGIENFSNEDGIQQIRFSKGNIKETFGEVLATIKREFNI